MRNIKKRVKVEKCIICGSESYQFKNVNGYKLHKCAECGLDFLCPMPTKQSLHDFYNDYKDVRASTVVSRMNAARNFESIQKNYPISSESNVLDYGCGGNQFVRVCRENEFFNSFGYDQFVDDLNDRNRMSWGRIITNSWDVITLWGVLEHVTDPKEELLTLKRMLSDEGLIVLTTIYTEARIPFQYKPPEHTLYFTKDSILRLAELVGLSVVTFEDYEMIQDSDVYFSILLRTMPEEYKALCKHQLEKFVEVPTNEIRVTLKK